MPTVNNRLSSPSLFRANSNSAEQSGNIDGSTTQPQTKEEYLAHWREWAQEAPVGAGEQRDRAVNIMLDCLERHSNVLYLINLSLSSLPEFIPQQIETLDLSDNKFRNLPRQLPPNVTGLRIDHNELTSLAGIQLNNLSDLSVCYNLLETLPEPLPQNLSKLKVSHNLLNFIPEVIPETITFLDISNNRLVNLPPSIVNLPQHAYIATSNNPLSERTIRHMINISNASNYHGPRIFFSMSRNKPLSITQPLQQVITKWLQPDEVNATAEKWNDISKESGAGEFSGFLTKLGSTVNARNNEEFKQQVASWLIRLTADGELREMTFAVAFAATESCEDRVTLAWNDMQIAELIHLAVSGTYDNKLPELVTIAREKFRLEKLEVIARKKIETLAFVDELDVYLAFQTKLKSFLELNTVAEKMRFFDVASVSTDDLKAAEIQVKTAENDKFPQWLCRWTPWQKVIERIAPAAWDEAREQRYSMLDSIEYKDKLDSALKAEKLMNVGDAEQFYAKKILKKMEINILLPLTQQLLDEKGHQDLLLKKWQGY
ncbi:NEL-type E3 ubiquitin ligase domain-containing protein [Pantoea cypripedii]|uniref:NEL-type E3 ubiquitin ligase domain-containing protein n=1 Tax=Pantoea cypripedii TaxID=55209 RepID=UPI002FCB4F7A